MQVELILLVLSMLFFASIFTDKIGYKFGVPALLLFLAVGMLFGPDGLGKLVNEDGVGYMLNVGSAQAIGTIALCIILFSGGLDTKLSDIRPVINPGLTLATIGVLLTMHLRVDAFCFWCLIAIGVYLEVRNLYDAVRGDIYSGGLEIKEHDRILKVEFHCLFSYYYIYM